MSLMNDLSPYGDILRKFALFKGVPEALYEEALSCLNAVFHTAVKGQQILSLGDPFHYAYLLLEGNLECSFTSETYDEITLDQFYPGSLMGHSFAFLNDPPSPIQITAKCDSVYLTFDLHSLTSTCAGCDNCFSYRHLLVANLTQSLANQNIFLNQKVRILGQKSIRDRIRVYLTTLPKSSKGYVTLPFSKTDLAEYLGLNRSAMSRELSNMVADGLIEIEGRRIKIKEGRR